MSRTALVVSYDSTLLSPYREALAGEGYRMVECASLSAALGAVGPGTAELLLLSPDVPAGDRRRVEGEARRRKHDIKIVVFYSGERSKDVFADAMLSLDDPPAALLEAARTLLRL